MVPVVLDQELDLLTGEDLLRALLGLGRKLAGHGRLERGQGVTEGPVGLPRPVALEIREGTEGGEEDHPHPDSDADLVAVRGNPLEEISEVREPVLVMKNGEIVLDRREGE